MQSPSDFATSTLYRTSAFPTSSVWPSISQRPVLRLSRPSFTVAPVSKIYALHPYISV
ncbi:hypothetical protein M413DRAFT_448787 [Hebeloma cylindrosporum]|uniref:Uncharacterized protein n=1 Tax=Hebeloma cylindrosporum TaxID=76867 RepID=A0A0C3BK78_HEBCY|nr:hypothetical protein M413DRAFT_448787 [Hebeloma cylindrosporum h7]